MIRRPAWSRKAAVDVETLDAGTDSEDCAQVAALIGKSQSELDALEPQIEDEGDEEDDDPAVI